MAQERAVAGSNAGKYLTSDETDQNMSKGLSDKLKSLGYAQ